jgi:hypothetical protein
MKRIFTFLFCLLTISGCVSNNSVANQACGKVSVFFETPEVKDIYPAEIASIDGRNVVAKGAYSLSEGKHTLKIYEKISDPRLQVPAIHRGFSQLLEINVLANRRYNIGAQFIADKRFSLENDYWQPVVWQELEERCE